MRYLTGTSDDTLYYFLSENNTLESFRNADLANYEDWETVSGYAFFRKIV